MPHRLCPVADCRQLARSQRQAVSGRKPLRITAQAASATTRQKEKTETAQRQPTPSEDNTHVPIKTGEPTDPAHVANGAETGGRDMEVDSVLAQELSENGKLPAAGSSTITPVVHPSPRTEGYMQIGPVSYC